jgi:hypothetical protein
MVRIKRQQTRKQVKTIDTILMERELRCNKKYWSIFIQEMLGADHSGSVDITHVINYKSAAFYEMKSTASPK